MTWHQIAAANRLLEKERGAIRKDWGGRLPVALVFPNSYYLGMSSLAVHTLYRMWNDRDDVVCERVFAGLLGQEVFGKNLGQPYSLESAATLDYFPVVALSISYEMDYFNVVALLRAASIPLRAADRDDTHPLLLAGGPAVSANPEPLAPLLDAIVIGEVEPVFDQLTDALHLVVDGRDAALDALAQITGLYLPNAPSANTRIRERQTITRQWLPDLDSFPTHSVLLTPNTEFADMSLLEIARGCGRGCRFCMAGYTYRPPRQRTVENILAQAHELLRRGERLGLVSAAVSDYTQIDELAAELRRLGARLSVSSLRVDALSEPLVRAMADSGARTLTIAPEAGSQRLRKVINKTQTEEDVLRAVDLAARHGLAQLKLYFMLGLPTEEEQDVQALVDLARACAERFARQVTVNVTPFVPKAHTPFQRLAQTPADVVKRRLSRIERALRREGIGVKSESPAWAEIQGTLARGDRRLAEAMLVVDRLTPATWRRVLAGVGIPVGELLGQRAVDETLPWGFIQSEVHTAHLEREVRRAEAVRTSLPCLPGDCVACGVCD
ncbi:MAG TPA: radical SAM protein [Anaerolineae bacterium]|nr:radical SAM protein [Anaerolineae bacterium]